MDSIFIKEKRGLKTRQKLESEKTQAYAQKPRLKLPFKNFISGNVHATCSIQTKLLILTWIVALFENIYDGEPIPTVFFVSVDDLQQRCFSVL